MADESPTSRPATEPLGWPLVDRRRRPGGPPDGRERRVRPGSNRVDQLAEANELLVALHEVAQRLPSSLDLDEVLDSTVEQVRALVGGDVVTILLRDPTDDTYQAVRGRGSASGAAVERLPTALVLAAAAEGAVEIVDLLSTPGIADEAVRGLYVAARAREQIVGVIAVECRSAGEFGDEAVTLLTALAPPFAVAVDNARLFRRIRSMAADEERRRLARDVHDRIGSSVALLGFELDRILGELSSGADPVDDLRTLRTQIATVVGQVRETLSDLRTDVSDDHDLADTLRSFLDRLGRRSSLTTHLRTDVGVPLPTARQRELWHMALEALINAERHSGASNVWVDWVSDESGAELKIKDDGKGLQSGAGRADSYGLTGMRERAAAIGARVQVTGSPDEGTSVTIRMGHPAR